MPLSNIVLSDFLAWSLCFGAFVALQESFCRRFPGLRTLCRELFVATSIIALAFGLWALTGHRGGGPIRLLASVNHAFAVGVFAQTSIRSLFLVRWLFKMAPAFALVCSVPSERHAVASLTAINQLMRVR
jgi:hypothetical protein